MTTPEGPRVVSDGFLSREELSGRHVLVIGLGISGRAVSRVLQQAGAKVSASDADAKSADHPEIAELRDLGVEIETGGHKRAMKWMPHVDIVIPSPGIAPKSHVVSHAIAEGVPVLSEIEVAYRFANAPVIAVTGTNGKTSTCRMIGSMLTEAGQKAVTCGNIGHPFVSAALENPEADAFVVEVSSFQLTFCYAFHPAVAVITNFAPDHLDWHGSMEAYKVAKSRIAARQGRNDWFVYPAAQPDLASLAPTPGPRRVAFSMEVLRSGDGVWLHGTQIDSRVASDVVVPVADVSGIARFGGAMVEDALAAASASLAFGLPPEPIAAALDAFRPDHHRVETVGEIDAVRFVDDSKATNPHATIAAVKNFPRVVLIAGGRNKGVDLQDLRQLERRLVGVVAIGESAEEIVNVFKGSDVPVVRAGPMADAVERAFAVASAGEVVLLSPACSSFDQYGNYGERGDAFVKAFEELSDKKKAER